MVLSGRFYPLLLLLLLWSPIADARRDPAYKSALESLVETLEGSRGAKQRETPGGANSALGADRRSKTADSDVKTYPCPQGKVFTPADVSLIGSPIVDVFSQHYGNNMHCFWVFDNPEQVNLTLEWAFWDLQTGGSCKFMGMCFCDYVQIEEEGAGGRRLQYCDAAMPPAFTSTAPRFTVTFTSDSKVTATGFKLVSHSPLARDEPVCADLGLAGPLEALPGLDRQKTWSMVDLRAPFPAAGWVTTLAFWALRDSPSKLRISILSSVGDDACQFNMEKYQEVGPIKEGRNEFEINLAVEKGQYLGFTWKWKFGIIPYKTLDVDDDDIKENLNFCGGKAIPSIDQPLTLFDMKTRFSYRDYAIQWVWCDQLTKAKETKRTLVDWTQPASKWGLWTQTKQEQNQP